MTMGEQRRCWDEAIGPASFVQSELFARTFREGMALVEETASYLDGDGREASKDLSRAGALAYAGASMRLTTQLMQIASWLLVLRAVREGDMSADEAWQSKYRLPTPRKEGLQPAEGELPKVLTALIDAANQLFERIGRLDAELFQAAAPVAPRGDAAAQQRALMDAFHSDTA